MQKRTVLADHLQEGDILVGQLTDKPKWRIRTITRGEDSTAGRYVTIDPVRISDESDGYSPIELPAAARIEIVREKAKNA